MFKNFENNVVLFQLYSRLKTTQKSHQKQGNAISKDLSSEACSTLAGPVFVKRQLM